MTMFRGSLATLTCAETLVQSSAGLEKTEFSSHCRDYREGAVRIEIQTARNADFETHLLPSDI